jgi:hypothetical protein
VSALKDTPFLWVEAFRCSASLISREAVSGDKGYQWTASYSERIGEFNVVTENVSMSGTLIRSNGAQLVTPEELATYQAPPPQGRWYPLPHSEVYHRVRVTLEDAGFIIERQQLAVSREGSRFFGTVDLQSRLAEGINLAVGIRNSIDKSFPIGFVAGSRVMVCENLAFAGELLVTRKHTKHGSLRFGSDIQEAVMRLDRFKVEESLRIVAMQDVAITDQRAESLIIRAMDKGIIATQDIPRVLTEWRVPAFKEFENRTLWSLFNAFTSALKPKEDANPQRYATLTMRLSSHLVPLEVQQNLSTAV